MTDYTELVKALTCGNDGKLPCHNNECPYWVDQWHGIGLCNVIKKDADAAAAIEALQTDLREFMQKCAECEPERGEWIATKYYTWECSVCGKNPTTGMGYVQTRKALYNYCPNCGAKMEVQE